MDMAGESRPGPARPVQKRHQGTDIFCNYDPNYQLRREGLPYRVYGYQRIPPLINQVSTKIRRTPVGLGVKSSCSPYKASRNSHLPSGQIKLHTAELHSIREALSQIKAQVDSLLESLEHIDRQRDPSAETKGNEENWGLENGGSSCRITESPQEPKGLRAHPEEASSKGNTDTAPAVKNQASH